MIKYIQRLMKMNNKELIQQIWEISSSMCEDYEDFIEIIIDREENDIKEFKKIVGDADDIEITIEPYKDPTSMKFYILTYDELEEDSDNDYTEFNPEQLCNKSLEIILNSIIKERENYIE